MHGLAGDLAAGVKGETALVAGDLAAGVKGETALVAGDIVDYLPFAWRSLEGKEARL